MSLSFSTTSGVISDPLKLVGGPAGTGPVTVTITNTGTSTESGLGIWLKPATSLGDISFISPDSPFADYQNLLRWGTASYNGTAATGGLVLGYDPGSGSVTKHFRYGFGDSQRKKVTIPDIAAGATYSFTLELQTPPSVSAARNIYVDVEVR